MINFAKPILGLIEGGIAVDSGMHYKEDGVARKLADEKGVGLLDFWQYCSTLKVGE